MGCVPFSSWHPPHADIVNPAHLWLRDIPPFLRRGNAASPERVVLLAVIDPGETKTGATMIGGEYWDGRVELRNAQSLASTAKKVPAAKAASPKKYRTAPRLGFRWGPLMSTKPAMQHAMPGVLNNNKRQSVTLNHSPPAPVSARGDGPSGLSSVPHRRNS
jgi:hypothetical protein